ncbi:PUA-like domain-containing protein [Zopfochytrium polystomum]|nr:PUA-like domain-containing protein [Zopfochytrium polystomum]
MNLMMSPITSPCGHSWCRACALRSLDHSRRCPLCRTIMPGVGYALRRPVTKALENLCQLQISKPAHPAEIPSVEKPFEIAVFVCSLAFPESSPSFHIFEPRYRVMIEECLRGSRRFGICLPERSLFTPASYVSCGTVLEITHSEAVDDDKVMTSLGVLPRYIVNTSAVHRFQVLSRRQTAEGLDYATVVRIEDVDGEDVGFEKPGSWDPISLASNLLRTRSFLIALLESLPSHVKTMFLSQNKPIPSDPAAFTFWLANILPLHPYQKYELLPMTSVAERLEKLVAWISLIAPIRSPSRDSD